MRIGMIRHGETDWNRQARFQGRSDIPLNAYGVEQAQTTAVLLRGQPWRRLYTSPLQRARHTAAEIAAALELGEPEVLTGMVERGFGDFEGETVFTVEGTRRYADGPTVEPIEAVLERTLAALREVAQGEGDALIVTHGTVVRLLFTELLTVPCPSVNNLGLSILTPDDTYPRGFRPILANGYPTAEALHATM